MRRGGSRVHIASATGVQFRGDTLILLVLFSVGVCLLPVFAVAGEAEPTKAGPAAKAGGAPEEISPWFFLLGFSNAHPAIQSEQLIDRYFDPIISSLAPTYDEITTVGDLRDDFLLWVPYVGVGRILSDKWAAFAQVGYAAGKVRTEADDRSLLLLPMHTDFEIKRAALYGGVGLDYFPFGMPELKEYHGVMERLRAARPNIGTRLTWTNATYEAKVKVGFKPFDNFLNYKEDDEWILPSASANIGVDVPLNKRSQVSINASYNRFNDERDDFEGPSYTIIWKRYFKAKRK
ncbi:MAG: hypothetical protein IT365_20715 [Candidatus Hydrogenedentes bacterium]|nr:hypothetical protein [Candidatus Hydrogenedentota bacterium]